MDLSNLKRPEGAGRNKKRRGRGESSGIGGTAGRGHKGQRARSSGNVGIGFEGGQMPMQRRLPKRGFTNIFRKEYTVVNLSQLAECFKAGETVDPKSMVARKVIRKVAAGGLKILSDGDLKVPLTVKAHKCSKRAMEKIQAAGGTFEQL